MVQNGGFFRDASSGFSAGLKFQVQRQMIGKSVPGIVREGGKLLHFHSPYVEAVEAKQGMPGREATSAQFFHAEFPLKLLARLTRPIVEVAPQDERRVFGHVPANIFHEGVELLPTGELEKIE